MNAIWKESFATISAKNGFLSATLVTSNEQLEMFFLLFWFFFSSDAGDLELLALRKHPAVSIFLYQSSSEKSLISGEWLSSKIPFRKSLTALNISIGDLDDWGHWWKNTQLSDYDTMKLIYVRTYDYMYMYISLNVCMHVCIFPTLPHEQDVIQGPFRIEFNSFELWVFLLRLP